MESIRMGISACLLGQNVRYDGGHQRDPYLTETLGRYVKWVPVCPEVECGLPVPREAMRLVEVDGRIRLLTRETKIDQTERMQQWAEQKCDGLENMELCGFVFKSRSPSSGMSQVKIYPEKGGVALKKGIGLYAGSFMRRFPLLPVEDDGRLNDPALRENFIERVFVYHRWMEFVRILPTGNGLVDFHTRHKLLIMAHSPKGLAELGRKTAGFHGKNWNNLIQDYLAVLMTVLRLPATVKKNANVLQHILGYFKKQLTTGEKQEALQIIGDYQQALIPLIVPVTLLNHFVRKYDQPYLKNQWYLYPHPAELMLRNHV